MINRSRARTFVAVCLFSFVTAATMAQEASTPSAKDVLKQDLGTWTAEIQMWMDANGQPDDTAEPMKMTGTETNRMIGDFWVVGDFEGEFQNAPYSGHAMSGYDAEKKKFTSTWVDSMTPVAMTMEGTYDAATKTLTMKTKGAGADGKPVEGVSKLTYKDAETRLLTMYQMVDGKAVKNMEILYKRKK